MPLHGRAPTILIADLEWRQRAGWTRLLASQGYSIVLVNNGQQTLSCVDRGGIDLAIVPVEMPEMNGLELLRALQDRDRPPPVIVFANGDSAIDKVFLRSAALLGATHTFVWPLAESALLDSVHAVLG